MNSRGQPRTTEEWFAVLKERDELKSQIANVKEESRLDKMTARESSDWFDALLIELSGLLGCGKGASDVIAAVKTCVGELASRDAEYARGAKMLADNATVWRDKVEEIKSQLAASEEQYQAKVQELILQMNKTDEAKDDAKLMFDALNLLQMQARDVGRYSGWPGMCDYLSCPDAREFAARAIADFTARHPVP